MSTKRPSVRVTCVGALVEVRLLTGSEPLFGRIMSPHGARGVAPPPSEARSNRVYFVPLEAAAAICRALSRAGLVVFAAKEHQGVIERSAFRCGGGGGGRQLYPHQRVGAEFLRVRRRAILADEMGVGKTPTALASLDGSKGALVVCPAVMVGEWLKETARWRPDLRAVLWKRPYGIWPDCGEVVVATYNRLPEECVEERSRCPWCEKLTVVALGPGDESEGGRGGDARWTHYCVKGLGGCDRSFNQKSDAWMEAAWCGPKPRVGVQLVLDEAHYCKTRASKRTTLVRAIASQCLRVSMLTGTPLLNEPMDLWTLCSLMAGRSRFDTAAHSAFGTMARFGEMFRGKKNKWGGWDWRDEDPDPQVSARLAPLMLRRTRAEVLSDLPAKRRRFIDVEVSGSIGAAAGSDVGRTLDSMSDDEVVAACSQASWLASARAELANAKLGTLIDLVEDYESAREPLVVFSYHRAPIAEVGARKGWGLIVGGTDALERTRLVEAFQAGKLKGIAGTIGAMGVGVTLTRAASVLFLDRDYVPANNLQAEDRCCRIGQTRGVVVTVLCARHPVDERVEAILARKQRMLEGVGLGEAEAVSC